MLYSISLLLAFSALALPALTAVHPSKRQLLSRSSKSLAPIVIPASQNFEGNDGPWSSFTLQIGTPAQDVNVLRSTAGYQTWAVVLEGCTPSDPPSCAILQGGEFLTNRSTTWTRNNVTTNGTFTLGLELNFDYSVIGWFGYDIIGLGWQGSNGPSLDQQIIAGIATKGFYLGLFCLNPRPTNFINFDHLISNYMTNLKERSTIPSLSWSYTAENQYWLNKVLGSLVLDGYDASRFVPNDLSSCVQRTRYSRSHYQYSVNFIFYLQSRYGSLVYKNSRLCRFHHTLPLPPLRHLSAFRIRFQHNVGR